MRNATKPIGVYFEHPDWFRPLFSELDRRELLWQRINAAAHTYDPQESNAAWSLVVNRASPSAYLRGHGQTIFHTLHWLRHVERLGVPIVNGSAVYALELSKANQLDLLTTLGLPSPRAYVINSVSRALEAARSLRYPVLIKANVGGSGAGITRYDSEQQLAEAVIAGSVTLGIDGVALVQECAPLRGGHITRVETLAGEYLYAINVYPPAGSFNLCPADACETIGGLALIRGACAVDAPKSGMRVEGANPPKQIIAQVERIARAARLDVGGIEYLVDDRDGQHYFYDINVLSNFVADAPNVIGFDPFVNFVDYLERRVGLGTVDRSVSTYGAMESAGSVSATPTSQLVG